MNPPAPRPIVAVVFALALFCTAHSRAQQPSEGRPASSNVPDAMSPRVFSDRSVSFTLKAPEAKAVQVAGGDGLGKGPFAMTKGDNGVWSVTIPSVVPGFHYY